MKTEREKFCAGVRGPYSEEWARDRTRRRGRSDVKEEFADQSTTSSKPNTNYEKSGVLCEETNMRNGVLLKHSLPLEARMPTEEWFVMSFAASDNTEKSTHLRGHIEYIIGTEKRVCDLPWQEPTMSRQHAVICFRMNSMKSSTVSPYVMDLSSLNGTYINGDRIEPCRYYEILDGDLLTFGDGEWEHIFIKEPSRSADNQPLLNVETEEIDSVGGILQAQLQPPQNAVVRAMASSAARQPETFDTAT